MRLECPPIEWSVKNRSRGISSILDVSLRIRCRIGSNSQSGGRHSWLSGTGLSFLIGARHVVRGRVPELEGGTGSHHRGAAHEHCQNCYFLDIWIPPERTRPCPEFCQPGRCRQEPGDSCERPGFCCCFRPGSDDVFQLENSRFQLLQLPIDLRLFGLFPLALR